MPFIRGPSDSLWRFLLRQQGHLRYPEKVWVQDYSYLEKCTAFIYQRTEIDDCDTKRGFLCEIDPKVSIIMQIAVINNFNNREYFIYRLRSC